MSHFVKAIQTKDIPVGTSKVVDLEGFEIAIFSLEDSFYALSNVCPHVGGELGGGPIRGNVVTCMWHGWEFDITNGARVGGGKAAGCYSVKIENDWVLVEIPD